MLLKGGCVLSLDKRVGNLPQGDVLVEDGRVAEVGRGLRARNAEVVDATDTIVMPGFVDTHRHVWRTLFRQLDPAATDATTRLEGGGLGPDDVYAATLVGLLSAAEAGITTVVDWADVPPDDRCTEAALQAHADAGLRTVFVHPVPDRPDTGDDGAVLGRVLDRCAAAGGATTVAFGSPDATQADLARLAPRWAAARTLGLRIHAHVGTAPSGTAPSEATPSEAGVVAALAAQGLLAADVTLAHGPDLDDQDVDAIATHGAAVSSAPSREMAVHLRRPSLQRLIDRGIRPGLGVGDESVAPGDLFTQMRLLQSVQHAAFFDLKLGGKSGLPDLLGTRDVIRYATADGARVAGLGDVTGSLLPGKQADIVVLRTDRPNVFPVNDPIGAVVWAMDASNVDWVLVGGRPLVRAGVLDADVERARALLVAARERVVANGGGLLQTGAGDGGAR